MKATTILNWAFKGGIGKTTLTVMMGVLLARRGKRILFVDCDPQSNCSEVISKTYHKPVKPMVDLYHGFANGDLSNSIVHITHNIDIMPGDWRLNSLVDKLAYVNESERYYVLKELLDPYKSGYDFILIDTPPTLNDIVKNAIFAANGINIIVQTQASAYTSAIKTLEQLVEYRTKDNANFKLLGVVLYLYEKAKIDRLITSKAKRTFGSSIYPTPIKYQQRVKMFSENGVKLHHQDHWDKRAINNYNLILNEIITRCEEMLY